MHDCHTPAVTHMHAPRRCSSALSRTCELHGKLRSGPSPRWAGAWTGNLGEALRKGKLHRQDGKPDLPLIVLCLLDIAAGAPPLPLSPPYPPSLRVRVVSA